jgi:regulation of enolase protein 1 (concanavalin A-like superfamily)
MTRTERVSIAGLPELDWTGPAGQAISDGAVLQLMAEAGTDWYVDPLLGLEQHDASGLVFPAPRRFTFSARLTISGPRSTFDAGGLCVWASADRWAKLCFERTPDGGRRIVSVVTNGVSDDAESEGVSGEVAFLRIGRLADGWAFHWSSNGDHWQFVRAFQLDTARPVYAGFLAQAPQGAGRPVLFDSVNLRQDVSPALRDGS